MTRVDVAGLRTVWEKAKEAERKAVVAVNHVLDLAQTIGALGADISACKRRLEELREEVLALRRSQWRDRTSGEQPVFGEETPTQPRLPEAK